MPLAKTAMTTPSAHPVVITKRVAFTLVGGVVLVSFACGAQSFDYPFDVGRNIMTEEQAMFLAERRGYITEAYSLFLAEVDLGKTPHDVEIRAT